MTHNPPISMYVPARNAGRTLAACIAAIRSQTRPPDELFIVLDPRSTDDTAKVAKESGLRVVEQVGPTLGSARNEAIASAAHDWLASCDSDVVLESDWLERLAAARDENAAGIGGRTLERIRGACDEWRAINMPHHWGDHRLRNPFMLVSEVMFDRRALRAVGGYRDDLNYYEDSDLCQRLREAGFDLLYEPSAIGTHLRTDSLRGLLTLRWKYSEYRQRHLLDRFAGLAEKMRVNREYALNTLSRVLARRREGLAYISFLLFFHHMLMDLRSLLSRRPLLSAAAKSFCERQVLRTATGVLGSRSVALAGQVREDLTPLLDATPPLPTEAARTSGWMQYLDDVGTAVTAYCDQLPGEVLRGIESSVRACVKTEASGRTAEPAADDAWSFLYRALSPESRGRTDAVLAELPLGSFINRDFLGWLQTQWPDMGAIRVTGPLGAAEQAAITSAQHAMRSDRRSANVVAIAAHLEARTDPLGAFQEIAGDIGRLVACYQAPSRFIVGLDVLSASDLASAAAAAGWTIERFDTLVGRTRLLLSRPVAASKGAPSHACVA